MYNLDTILEEVKATQEIEGLTLSEETETLINECISGNKTFEDARNEALKAIKKSLGM